MTYISDRLLPIVVVTLGLGACGGDSLTLAPAPKIAFSNAVGTVTVSPRTAIVAVGGTVDFTPTVTDLNGDPLTVFDSVVYRLDSQADTTRIAVTKSGPATVRVTGRVESSGPMLLDIFVFKNNTVQADQAFVHVTDSVPTGPLKIVMKTATTSVIYGKQPTVNTNLVNGVGDTVMVPLTRYRINGTDSAKILTYSPTIIAPGRSRGQYSPQGIPLSSEYVYFFGQMNKIAVLAPTGSAYVYGDVNAYGTELRDSVLFTFGYPSTFSFSIQTKGPLQPYGVWDRRALVSQQVYQSPATLTFRNDMYPEVPVDYVFDKPENALAVVPGGPAGNIINLMSSESRVFTTPGDYSFTVTVRGDQYPVTGQHYTIKFTVK